MPEELRLFHEWQTQAIVVINWACLGEVVSTKAVIDGHTIQRVDTVTEAHVRGLAELLIDCVDGGASVSFMHPLAVEKALDFWRRIAHGVARGERALLVAEDAGGLVGTVHLILDQPENQPHRADLSKMLVHRRARRQGLGEGLLRAAENVARDCGKSLLVLDTASADAERLYVKLGWQRCGVIPGYALLPHGGLCDTIYFYRRLSNDA
jgi:GNAT superfamily N-acetyltransferase